ncbi:hypothetical protein L3X38_021328 [Prunus dulcis]|uniref:LisH dimerisation motif n=1 Tax=Prunus dulcis TaxID=3755 RepID=A0AAD4VWL9_PRUDU|nr:transcriptional corepressor LEUNIG_HOMOLOG-like [Prunus dulcis]KAI5331202.1 hypothetical protein L3X38_021328 [Prunus dulcis]
MGSGQHWDAEKMLDLYLHDYMVKKNMHKTAAAFRKEANVCGTPVVINTPDGFLHEWWSLFHDVYAARELKHQEAKAEASLVKAMQTRENEGQNKRPSVTHIATNKQRPPQFDKGTSSRRQSTGDFCPSLHPVDVNKLNVSKPVTINSSHVLQQFPNHPQQQVDDSRNVISVGRTISMDRTLYGLSSAILPVTGAQDAGMVVVNPGTRHVRPLTVLNSALQAPNHQQQIQTLTAEHQHPVLGQMIGQWRPTAAYQHQHDWPQQQQLLENDRKRRTAPFLRAGGIPLGDINTNEEIPVEANAESFLSYGDDNADGTNTTFRFIKRRATACNTNEQKGFTFEEVGCLHSSKSKVLCCHFSSEGNLLASAGHEKKVLIWNMETFDFDKTSEGHSLLITDIRFQPNSTIFATSSFDKTVKIWDAARSSKSLSKLLGHTGQVMSLDFHPRKVNLLCSCDNNDEVRLWDINQCTCTSIFKGATKQVRFQPQFGKFLATSSGNGINVFDVETGSLKFSSKGSGHVKDVVSLCWDTSGKYLASVSEDSARVWSTASNGKWIHELKSNGNKFQSCTFHPGYPLLLIIGGYQSLELWNPSESSKTLTVPAHKGLVVALAESPKTEMVASVSHDQCVKLWK